MNQWLIFYIICGLINVYALLRQASLDEESDGTVLPTEIIASFLGWPLILLVQLIVAMTNMIYDKIESEDNDDLS